MNNITIGQYLPGNSIIHKLDARIKIISMLILIITTFLIPIKLELGYIIWAGGMLLLSIILILMAKVPITKVLNGMKGMVFLLSFTFILQLFTINTGTLLLEQPLYFSFSAIGAIILLLVTYFLIKPYLKFKTTLFLVLIFLIFYLQAILPYGPIINYQISIYTDGLLRAGFIFARILSVMMFASLLTFTTSTIELNDGLESVLKPFKYIRVPTATIAMMLSLTLRSIPTLLEETQKIMKAQTSRGVDFKESKLRDKVVQIISLLIPIFVISFKRSEDLANAMEVRGYVIGAPRTKLDKYQLKVKDYFALTLITGLLVGYILFRVYAV